MPHSKGPYTVTHHRDHPNDFYIDSAEGWIALVAAFPSLPGAVVEGTPKHGGNAQLLAASWQLLEACKTALDILDLAVEDYTNPHSIYYSIYAAIKAAEPDWEPNK